MALGRGDAPEHMIVHVPMTFRRYGGRKQVVLPDEVTVRAPAPRVDDTLVKALARAFRWRKLLETGVHSTVADIARAEKINSSYVSRILRLTLLAPDVVEAILEGRQGPEVTLVQVLGPLPVLWAEHRKFTKLDRCNTNDL